MKSQQGWGASCFAIVKLVLPNTQLGFSISVAAEPPIECSEKPSDSLCKQICLLRGSHTIRNSTVVATQTITARAVSRSKLRNYWPFVKNNSTRIQCPKTALLNLAIQPGDIRVIKINRVKQATGFAIVRGGHSGNVFTAVVLTPGDDSL